MKLALAADARRFVAGLATLTVQSNVSGRLNLFTDGCAQIPEERRGAVAV